MSTAGSTRKLSLVDIADTRAYERERDGFRRHVIALKKRRRLFVGPFVSFVFENRDTIRFQIQEMARVERTSTDEGIQGELDVYNPLIPEAGELSATMFIELTNDAELRTWLPRLVGIERSIEFRLADGSVVAALPDEVHQTQLTREDTTASVHYVHWRLNAEQVAAFHEPVELAITHPDYTHSVRLGDQNIAELRADLVD